MSESRLSVLESKVERHEIMLTSMQDIIARQAEMNQKLVSINDKFVHFQKDISHDVAVTKRLGWMVTGALILTSFILPLALRFLK